MGTFTIRISVMVLLSMPFSLSAAAQSIEPSGGYGSIATPRPINPATGTTNPSARATQTLNPYLGSTPDRSVVHGELKLNLEDAVTRGLRFNLGLLENQQANASVRAQRERALAALLPQISANTRQVYQRLSFKELGIKLPSKAGIQLPPTSGGFGYSDVRFVAQSAVLNVELINKYRSQKAIELASALSEKDACDVVVFAVGTAYFQVVASQARLETVQAALVSARELETQIANQYKSELAPEIDALRAQVELHTAEQRLVDAANNLEKDKLTLDRITGIPLEQAWVPSGNYDYTPLQDVNDEAAHALETRADVASLKQTVASAELDVKAARAQRLPAISLVADYGGAGLNPANYNQVYSITGEVSIPILTSGRIRSEVHLAEAALVQHRAEYRDLEGRVAYDVRVARLDAKASESAVKVAAENNGLAQRALTQSQDRYSNGVTNYLEVVQAQEAVVAANENYIASLFSFNVAKISLARALGSTETRISALFDVR